ncbi:hypothetical protein [Shimia litoralis]|nr:hypothetical protein [Shimia litoralis]
MLRTITMGTRVSVQGTFECALPNGKITVRVGDMLYTGTPISSDT